MVVLVNFVWPKRPKGAKNGVKGPLDFFMVYFLNRLGGPPKIIWLLKIIHCSLSPLVSDPAIKFCMMFDFLWVSSIFYAVLVFFISWLSLHHSRWNIFIFTTGWSKAAVTNKFVIIWKCFCLLSEWLTRLTRFANFSGWFFSSWGAAVLLWWTTVSPFAFLSQVIFSTYNLAIFFESKVISGI